MSSHHNEAIDARMERTISNLHNDLKTIRSGRANPSVLDNIKVLAYGDMMPISQLGSMSTPDAKTIIIQVWDKSVMNDIEKAIQTSDLGLNPSNDGNVIRINVPSLTEDRRNELKKSVKHRGEEAKVAVRNIRRDENEKVKKQLKDKEITEDDSKDMQDSTQKITDRYIEKIDEGIKLKEEELSEI